MDWKSLVFPIRWPQQNKLADLPSCLEFKKDFQGREMELSWGLLSRQEALGPIPRPHKLSVAAQLCNPSTETWTQENQMLKVTQSEASFGYTDLVLKIQK